MKLTTYRVSLDHAVLLIIALAYILGYFFHGATPGNAPLQHPIGWWGWFDQGEYLKSAMALNDFDFDSSKHFYPPLYPMLGALFVDWSSGHMFVLVNLLCLLLYCYAFLRFARHYVGEYVAIGLLFATTILSPTVFQNWVIPWTTSLASALLSVGIIGLIWIKDLQASSEFKLTVRHVLVVSVSLGLVVPTRPADAAAGLVIASGLLLGYLIVRRKNSERVPGVWSFLGFAIVGAAVGPLVFLTFNYVVFGDPLGGYFAAATGNGFHPYDIPEKAYSLWLDGSTLYAEPNAGLVQHFPWLYLSLAGAVWVLLKSDLLLKTVVVAILVHFAVYLPYSDLLPTGLWRYLSVHYFKWSFPYLGLIAFLPIALICDSKSNAKSRLSCAVILIAICVFLLGFRMQTSSVLVNLDNAESFSSNEVVFDVTGDYVDFVDVLGIPADFQSVYFGEHNLELNGTKMSRVKDYRVLPIHGGVRLLFIRPSPAGRFFFTLDKNIKVRKDKVLAEAGTYRFSLNYFNSEMKNGVENKFHLYEIGRTITFEAGGLGHLYTGGGWSVPEAWGVWSEAESSHLYFKLEPDLDVDLILVSQFAALIAEQHPCQRILIYAQDELLEETRVCLDDGRAVDRPRQFLVPKHLYENTNLMKLSFVLPDAISPSDLGLNLDTRQLGVALTSLTLSKPSF